MTRVRATSGLSWLSVLYSNPGGFSPGSPVFPFSKINISKFQFDRMQDLPENHFRVSGAFEVNIMSSVLIFLFGKSKVQLGQLTVMQ